MTEMSREMLSRWSYQLDVMGWSVTFLGERTAVRDTACKTEM